MPSASRRFAIGLLAALASALCFGTSGAVAKPLLATGWSSGALVFLRVGGAAAFLLIPALIAMRGRWRNLRGEWPRLLLYGVVSGAMVQVAFFNSVALIDVAVALLLEYTGILLVVVVVWVRTRKAPARLTLFGMIVAICGVVLVLNPAGGAQDWRGVLWGILAAVGMATFFLVSAAPTRLPPVAFVCFGLTIAAACLGIGGLTGPLPFTFATADAAFSFGVVPWWVAVLELALIAAAGAYLFGFIAAQRLGATATAFATLIELLVAVLWAGVLLGEVPSGLQMVGGAVLVGGVLAVQLDRARQAAAEPGAVPVEPDVELGIQDGGAPGLIDDPDALSEPDNSVEPSAPDAASRLPLS